MPLLKSFLILSDLVHSKFPTSSLQGALGVLEPANQCKPRPKLGKTRKSASKKAKSRNCFSEQNLQVSAVVFDYFQHSVFFKDSLRLILSIQKLFLRSQLSTWTVWIRKPEKIGILNEIRET